ncbi:MAG TPA: PHP domain-containing protein, partial [Thermoflexales bacterium]|nr:PHP domain-containing protein [Thermoflexales bacterium]
MSFVHLHVHSEYSMLDGLGNVKKLSARAKELGQDSLAITDHGVMHAAIEFVEAAGSAGIKPIIGMEGYLTMRGRTLRDREGKQDRSLYHMLLLAQNDTGYKNLMRMATIAQLEGFYYKPRLDHATLKEYAAGVIATTGCLAAEVPSLLADGQADQAREALLWYREIFGDRFYVELQDHDIPELDRINPTLVDWARELSIPLVLTNDSHYVKQGDSVAHDLMLCVQTTSMINDPKRMRFNNDSYYIKTEDEMRALCRNIPREAIEEAIANTKRIADQCNVKVKTKDFHLPHFKRPQRFASDNEYLRYLCEVGFEVRYGIPARADGVWVHEDNPPQAEDGFI